MHKASANRKAWSFPFVASGACLAALLVLGGCDRRPIREQPASAGPRAGTIDKDRLPRAEDPATIEVLFTYGSEKEEWIKDVTAAFNAQKPTISGGKTVVVRAVAQGSGVVIDELLEGRREAHLISPASSVWIELGNSRSLKATEKPLVGPTKFLVRSPVVIAMWKPMAQAMGWGKRPIGWSDVQELARNPQGWALHNKAIWGRFKFGHTHPQYSNSGLLTILAQVYASAGKTEDLALKDVAAAGPSMEDIEKAVVHYGESTGFFGKKMFANSPQYLNAAVLYENMVIESYDPKYTKDMDVVAIYPKEGTFWSDHPVGIVQRPWVTAAHREAAQLYIDYLLKEEQQRKALKYGFRPGDERVPLAAPIDREHGVDPREPRRTLDVPPAEVMEAIIKLWQQHKKRSRIVLVVDTSGSMVNEGRLSNAKAGANQLVSMLGERDKLSLLAFSSQSTWLCKDAGLDRSGRASVTEMIKDLLPEGETALFDSIEQAYQYLQEKPEPDKISAVVVLTDGEDNKSRIKDVAALLKVLQFDPEKRPVRVFTIAYGKDANFKILQTISEATHGKAYRSDPSTIRIVFKDIATFF
jgi:Ca-activated chloride channel family protein